MSWLNPEQILEHDISEINGLCNQIDYYNNNECGNVRAIKHQYYKVKARDRETGDRIYETLKNK